MLPERLRFFGVSFLILISEVFRARYVKLHLLTLKWGFTREVIVKKPIKLAVALKYENDEPEAPVVVASGRGEIAEKILAMARQGKVPVYQDESLAQVLASLEMGTEIPPELYQAVAQVIAFVWKIDNKYSQ
jgi:flagellar biosynthesis protein